jgi:hypothetical protein
MRDDGPLGVPFPEHKGAVMTVATREVVLPAGGRVRLPGAVDGAGDRGHGWNTMCMTYLLCRNRRGVDVLRERGSLSVRLRHLGASRTARLRTHGRRLCGVGRVKGVSL